MHRIAAIASAAAFALVSFAAVQAQTPTATDTPTAKKAASERVCREQVKSGSRVKKRTICMSTKEADRLSAEARQVMDQRLLSAAGSPPESK